MPNKSQKGKQMKNKKTKTFLSLPVKENIIDIPILEKIGFKKVPTTDGFVMYELTPSRLNQQKEKA
jgi:hypothetical protein